MMAKQGTSSVVPRLRFPEFREADGWKPKTLGNVCRPQQWATISGSALSDIGFPVYGANGFIGFYTAYNHEFETVAVTCRGSTCGEVLLIPEKSYITGNSMCLDDIDAARNSYHFVYHVLKHRGFRDVISGSAQPQIVGNAIRKVRIAVPVIEEQQKIANCLTSLDEVMAAQGWKVEALKAHKRGLMQQLFPREGETRPRLRFPEFRNAPEWRPCVLGEVTLIVRGGSPRPIDDFLTHESGGLNWLKIGDVDREAKYVTKTEDKVRPEALSKTRVIQSGDFILSNSMSFGRPYISTIETCIHDGWIAVTSIPADLNRDFLYYSILSARSQKYFVDQAAGSGVQNLNKDIIKLLPLELPSEDEQQRIADCLSSLDTQITAESHQLAALKTHKQGLMQQLFPAPDGAGA